MDRAEGDLLHPERLPRALLEQRRVELGSFVYAAQYQQRPAPLEGGIVRWGWFRTCSTPPERREGDRIVQSWDTATRAEEASDYSVCTTWLVRGAQAWLLDLLRVRLEFPDLRRRIEAEAHRWDAGQVLVESAGSGVSLIQDLRHSTRLNVSGIVPRDDKATRLMSVSAMIEAGRVLLPAEAPWLAEFRRELTLFPNARHDDQVDSLSQFLKWFDQPPARWYINGKVYEA